MDGEKKFTVIMLGVVMLCLTVLYTFLFISLWPYRTWVGLSLLAVVVLFALVMIRGRLNEQTLRQERIDYHKEIPLDVRGEVSYWPQWAQQNPHRVQPPQGQASGYQQYGPYQRD